MIVGHPGAAMHPDELATERLRAALRAQCGDTHDVDARRTQYAFDEDWEAFSDIAVRARGRSVPACTASADRSVR